MINNPKTATKPIFYIVESAAADKKQVTTKEYPYLLKWAIDGWRELNLFLLPTVKTVCLQIESNYTIDLPQDFVNLISIGIRCGNHVYLLGRDDKMPLNHAPECQVPLEQVVASPEQFGQILPYEWFFSLPIRGGQYVGEQYAHGGGWSSKGYYRIDESCRQIQFSSMIPKTEVYIEYKSTGMDCDGSVEVPYQAISALVAYVHWQRTLNDTMQKNAKLQLMEIQTRERYWKSEYKKLQHFNLMFDLQTYLDEKYKTVQMGIKR